MAKMFYTLEEAKSALGKSEEEIRQFARDGRLREFRDGPRLMFKADQVEQLKTEVATGGGGEEEPNLDTVDLGVSDSGGLIGLVDTTGASGTSITLSDADVEVGGSGLASDMGADIGSGLGSGLGSGIGSGVGSGVGSGIGSGVGSGIGSGVGSGIGSSGIVDALHTDTGQSTGAGMTMRMKDDTALAQDLGLSGSLGGVPSPGRPATGTGTGLSGTASGRAGINVFGHDDVAEDVDPMAQTNISGGIRDQLALEGVGSGSGLLDLTRESDDTSLGAVLDEITPGPARRPFESPEGSFGGGALDEAPPPRIAAPPVYVEKHDAWAPAFGGAALAAAGIVVFGMFLLISAIVGTRPPAVQWLADQKMDLWKGAGLGVLPVIVFFIIGLILGKVTTPKRR